MGLTKNFHYSEKSLSTVRKKIITGLISFFQTYDKEFFQLKTAVCKAPNCSLGKEKLQFGQGKIIIQLTTANSLAVLVFVASSANIKLCFKIAC